MKYGTGFYFKTYRANLISVHIFYSYTPLYMKLTSNLPATPVTAYCIKYLY